MTHHVLAKLVTYSATGPTKSVFFEEGRLKAQVMGLEPGQRIPPCSMDLDVAFVVLEGEGEQSLTAKRIRSAVESGYSYLRKTGP